MMHRHLGVVDELGWKEEEEVGVAETSKEASCRYRWNGRWAWLVVAVMR